VDGRRIRVLDGLIDEDALTVSHRTGFLLEATHPLGIRRERCWQDLDGDIAVQPPVMGRYTSPIPPAPIAVSTSYGPSVVPTVRGIGGRNYKAAPPWQQHTTDNGGSNCRTFRTRSWARTKQVRNSVISRLL